MMYQYTALIPIILPVTVTGFISETAFYHS